MLESQKTVHRSGAEQVRRGEETSSGWQDLAFVLGMWLLSRLLIVVAMQVIAPALNLPSPPMSELGPPFPPGLPARLNPSPGWELFTHWDGKWYGMIATQGYEIGADFATKRYSIVFPPLYPFLSSLVMRLGLPFEIAGTLVNNAAFLGALYFLYQWTKERYTVRVARWATVVMAWFPYSLFGTVAYTEGLFLLTTIGSLRSFDQKRYGWAAFWGALATATRLFGVALIPAFLIVAWKEKRPLSAYLAGLAVTGGFLVFLAYCAVKFGDPMVSFHAQASWLPGQENWKNVIGKIVRNRLIAPTQYVQIVTFFGGTWMLWHLRKKLDRLAVIYGFCYIGVLVASGGVAAVARYMYVNAPLSIALGMLLIHHPRWRLFTMSIFITGTVVMSILFSWWFFIV